MGCEFRESKPSLIAVARSGVHCHCVNVRLHLCKLLQVPIDFKLMNGMKSWGSNFNSRARSARSAPAFCAVHIAIAPAHATSGQ